MNKHNLKTKNSDWNWIYKIGGIAAIIAVLVFLLDIAISIGGGGDIKLGTLTAIDYFAIFQNNLFGALRALGLLNIISWSVSIPLFFAIYAAHRKVYKPYATLALIIYIIGIAIYLSNNAAIPMLALSTKYAAATTDAQRILIAAAGEAILATGEDFTPGSFLGLFIVNLGTIFFSFIQLRGKIFSKFTAYIGILGFVLLLIFIIWTTFIVVFYEFAMILAVIGGLLSIAWYILVARRLFQLSKNTSSDQNRI